MPPEAIQALAQVLKTTRTDSAVGSYAIKALGDAGPRAVPALTALTKNRNPQACQSAAEALGQIVKHDPAVWPILISLLRIDSNRAGATDDLAGISPPIIPSLRKTIKNDDQRVRAGTVETIAQMGKHANHSRQHSRREVVSCDGCT